MAGFPDDGGTESVCGDFATSATTGRTGAFGSMGACCMASMHVTGASSSRRRYAARRRPARRGYAAQLVDVLRAEDMLRVTAVLRQAEWLLLNNWTACRHGHCRPATLGVRHQSGGDGRRNTSAIIRNHQVRKTKNKNAGARVPDPD